MCPSVLYTIVSISSSSCFKEESCLVWPFSSWFKSGVFIPKAILNRLFLRKEPFWITTLSACLFSLARWRSSFLWRCLSACIRREQFILKMATILDISAFSSSLCLISSTRLGRIWSSFVPTRWYKNLNLNGFHLSVEVNHALASVFHNHAYWLVTKKLGPLSWPIRSKL